MLAKLNLWFLKVKIFIDLIVRYGVRTKSGVVVTGR